jgi:phosphoglucosamine mutase
MTKLFGTDGVRGVSNELLKPDLALKLGLAIAHQLKPQDRALRVLIGRDTRRSGGMLEAALTSGLCALGADVTSAGVLPTPAVAYLTREGHYDLGVVLSASHNPAPDNGIKLIGGDGYKLSDALESEIEATLHARGMDYPYPKSTQIGSWQVDEREAEHYQLFLLHLMREATQDRTPLTGLHLVVDCANGAAFRFAPLLLQELGAQTTLIGCEPDGDNINEDCGSIYLNRLKDCVLEAHADLGIAFDGDADRALFCDETGELVDGDRLMTLWALYHHWNSRLQPPLVVATEMSNLGMERRLQVEGIRLERTRVGDRYVSERMRETNALIGGEQSGHIIFSERATTGDGLVTMLETLLALLQSEKRFSEIAHPFTPFPQKLVSVSVCKKQGWDQNAVIQEQMEHISEQLMGRGRLNVRASGTENKIRVMVEAETSELLQECLNRMVDTIQEQLGGLD